MHLNTFLQHHYYIPYCTFRSSFKVNCSESGAKTHVQYMTVARLKNIGKGTYSCNFITLLEVRIAA